MKINQKCFNTLRILSAEMISSSQIGDTRSCYNSAPVMFTLFKDHYNFFGGSDHINRDRLVIGDVSLTPLYYATLHTFGINFSIDDLMDFGKEKNKLPITPQIETLGVDASISNKGQGIPTAVGLTIARESLASKFNAQKFSIISNYTYCFISNNNLEEGLSQEAMSLAGSLKLSSLIVLCDYNPNINGEENVSKKYRAIGWNVITVRQTNNFFWISFAISRAKLSSKPTLILFNNKNLFTKNFVQSKILNKNEVEKLKAELGLNGSYKVPNDVKQFCARSGRRLKVEYGKWEKKAVIYKNTHPKLSEELNEYFVKNKILFAKTLKQKIENITDFEEANKIIIENIKETRKCLMLASVKSKFLPNNSNSAGEIFSKENYRARSLVFGNRENAMAEICDGISLYFEAPTYVYAPICILGQMLSGIEHSAKMNLPVLYCFYQSGSCINQQKANIELYGQLEWLKNLKDFNIFNPANPLELLACYNLIYETEQPSCLIIPQQNFEKISTDFDNAKKGAYILEQDEKFQTTIIASGREIYLALEIKKQLNKIDKKAKIISAPSLTVFDGQNIKYKESLLNSQKENVVILTTTNNLNLTPLNLKLFTYININNLTDTPDKITPELVKSVLKIINK